MCPVCRRPMTDCTCKREEPPRGDGIVRVGRETKGRKGAGVTIITGVPLRSSALADLASRLKKKCATGGTVRDGVSFLTEIEVSECADLHLDVRGEKGNLSARTLQQDIGQDGKRMASFDDSAHGGERPEQIVALCFD